MSRLRAGILTLFCYDDFSPLAQCSVTSAILVIPPSSHNPFFFPTPKHKHSISRRMTLFKAAVGEYITYPAHPSPSMRQWRRSRCLDPRCNDVPFQATRIAISEYFVLSNMKLYEDQRNRISFRIVLDLTIANSNIVMARFYCSSLTW